MKESNSHEQSSDSSDDQPPATDRPCNRRTTPVLYAFATGQFHWIDVEQADYALPNMETEGTIEIEGDQGAIGEAYPVSYQRRMQHD